MLFATSGSSAPVLYIGKLGAMDLAGDVYVSDRDQSGAEVATHGLTTAPQPWMKKDNNGNSNWYDGWSTGTVRTVTAYKSSQQYALEIFTGSCNVFVSSTYYACLPILPIFPMKRADGYMMVGGIVQGARTYDPTSGQWLTPDPYEGDVSDPMSQKPFMWNDNNPVEWSDPSGYCTDPGPGQKPNGCLGGVDWNLNMTFGNFLQSVLSWVAVPAGPAGAEAKAAVALGRIGDEAIAHAIMSITDTRLGNIANALFKRSDSLFGGTAGALRHELLTGELVKGRSHFGKAIENVSALQNWLATAGRTASAQNVQAAEMLLKDLEDALAPTGSVPTLRQLYLKALNNQVPKTY
jgi:RHS repeat-associated protein